jgi:hypothetical protein
MPALQYWFTGTALAAFIAVVTSFTTLLAVSYGWYRAAVSEVDSSSSKITSAAGRKAKQLLGEVLASGGKLIGQQAQKTPDQYEKEAEAWGKNAHDLIVAAYGEGEAALFLDSSGYTFYSAGSEKSKVRNWIDGRMRRITELLRRTDVLAVQSNFDPKQFEK